MPYFSVSSHRKPSRSAVSANAVSQHDRRFPGVQSSTEAHTYNSEEQRQHHSASLSKSAGTRHTPYTGAGHVADPIYTCKLHCNAYIVNLLSHYAQA